MSDNPRPVLYGSGYETFLPRAVDAERPRTVTVVGKHCESRRPAGPRRRGARRPRRRRRAGHAGHRRLRPLDGQQLQQGAPARRWCSRATATPASSSAARPTTTCSPPTWAERLRARPRRYRRSPMSRDRCGSGCSGAATSAAPLVAARRRPGRRDRRPHRRAPRGRRASPCAAWPRSAPSTLPDGVLTTDAAAVVADPGIDVVVEVIGGIEPARELILAALGRRQAGRHRQQGAARQRRRRAVRRRRRRRRRPAVRGGRRRRHPAHPPAARVAGRRAHRAGARHRQRHDQLHPHQDDRGGRRLRRRPRRGPGARLRRARPDRRRRGLRRRRQGGDHRLDRLRRPGRRRRRVPRGHQRRSRRPTSTTPASSATS